MIQKDLKIMDDYGIAFAACTGKQCERVEELFPKKDYGDMWILGDSATRIKYKGEYIYESLLPNSIGQEIIQKLESISASHTIIACTESSAYIHSSVSPEIASKVRNSYAVVNSIVDLKMIKEPFVKITIFDPTESCFENVKLLEEFSDRAYIVASEASWIDISNYNVHKGTTVRTLQEILNIKMDETIAFGDGLNDIELFQSTGVTFAVKNAFGEILNLADFIVDSNENNGVIKTIERLISLQAN